LVVRARQPALHYVTTRKQGRRGCRKTISVRIASDKKAALDAIAQATDRDLSLVFEEALSAYLELHGWQVEHIEEGMRQAEAGEFASEAEVRAAFARWRC
jgi:predicted transcriptional regulator